MPFGARSTANLLADTEEHPQWEDDSPPVIFRGLFHSLRYL